MGMLLAVSASTMQTAAHPAHQAGNQLASSNMSGLRESDGDGLKLRSAEGPLGRLLSGDVDVSKRGRVRQPSA
jgi:hypothetical protein